MIKIIGTTISSTNYFEAVKDTLKWASKNESRYICIANVHMLMEAYDSTRYAEIINAADLVTPDGMPLVWLMRKKGNPEQQRVYGPTLMLHVLEAATRDNIPVGFYGSTPEVLETLQKKLLQRFPKLKISYVYSPPFRETTPQEDMEIINQINASNALILFIGLGCPKQEKWMSEHRGKVNAVMLGVGAAFDFHAGLKSQAPAWMQRNGLEWLFRLITEPRRLWKRYLYHNPRFIFLSIADLLGWL